MAVSIDREMIRRNGDASKDSPRSLLTKVIEAEIIPRLLLAHSDREFHDLAAIGATPFAPASDEDAFARLFLNTASADISAHLRTLIARGMTRERIYLDMLAPAARRLGVFWSEGECSFDDMAHGLSRIDEVLHDMRAAEPDRH